MFYLSQEVLCPIPDYQLAGAAKLDAAAAIRTSNIADGKHLFKNRFQAWRKGLFPGMDGNLLARLEQLYGLARHDRRYGMLIDELRVTVAPKQHAKIVKPRDDSLEFDPVNKEDGERDLVFTDKIEKCILKILWPVRTHRSEPFFVLGAQSRAYRSAKKLPCRRQRSY